jgi:hypothetical protein
MNEKLWSNGQFDWWTIIPEKYSDEYVDSTYIIGFDDPNETDSLNTAFPE